MPAKLRYPTGVRPLLAEETSRRRRLEQRFVELLERDGFAEVALPIIDYADPYAALIDARTSRQSYRFVDREGDLVTIRSDFTPMLARALAPSLRSEDLPLRLFYRGDVIRCEASRLGSNRELFQIGAEIVGDDSLDADVRMMKTAAELIRQFGEKPSIVYTDVSVAASLAALSPLIGPALISKRLAPADCATLPPAARVLVEKLVAGTATLDDLSAFAPAAPVAARLRAIGTSLPSDEFALHLDDVDETGSYYSGLRFRVYAGASRTRVAQGGRYDRLYERFGTPAPAIGFTFNIDDLEDRRPAAGGHFIAEPGA